MQNKKKKTTSKLKNIRTKLNYNFFIFNKNNRNK